MACVARAALALCASDGHIKPCPAWPVVNSCCGWLICSRGALGVHVRACMCLAPVSCPSASPRQSRMLGACHGCILERRLGTQQLGPALHTVSVYSQ